MELVRRNTDLKFKHNKTRSYISVNRIIQDMRCTIGLYRIVHGNKLINAIIENTNITLYYAPIYDKFKCGLDYLFNKPTQASTLLPTGGLRKTTV